MNRRGEEEAVRAWARAVLEPASNSASNSAIGSTPGPTAESAAAKKSGPLADDAEPGRSAWASLELPPAAAVPPGFALQVLRAWNRERESTPPILGALWMRAAAAAALLAGVFLGGVLSGADASDASAASDTSRYPGDALVTASTEIDAWVESSLSEEYLAALGEAETVSGDGGDGGDGASAGAITP